VQKWPSVNSTLWGIATSHGKTLAQIEALNPQLGPNWNLIYAGEAVRIS
jgi:LysM repeat protein